MYWFNFRNSIDGFGINIFYFIWQFTTCRCLYDFFSFVFYPQPDLRPNAFKVLV